MSDEDDLRIHKDEPPENGEGWQRVHRSVHRTEQTWFIIGPIYAFAKNWKAILFALAFIVFVNNPKIVQLAREILGVVK